VTTARRPRERGVALLLVLWVFMLLGVLALDFSRYIRDDAMAAMNYADETHGYYVALAGMNRAFLEQMQAAADNAPTPAGQAGQQQQLPTTLDDQPERLVLPDGQWHEGEFAGARWSVRMRDEGGRIPLNAIAKDAHAEFLRWIIKNLVRGGNATTGVDRRAQKTIDTVVDSIIDWRDHEKKAEAHANGAESDYYLRQRVPYTAKNGPLDSPEELLKIRGVTPALYYGVDGSPGMRDVFSVFAAKETPNKVKVNVRSAPPAVLQVLVGDADAVTSLLEQRDQGAPLAPLVQSLFQTNSGIPGDAYITDYDPATQPGVFAIEARADVSNERNQSHIAALVNFEQSDVKILQWFDRAPWDGALPGMPPSAEDEE
jgi:general secretion pathway protein K